jgi:hypothetical protein
MIKPLIASLASDVMPDQPPRHELPEVQPLRYLIDRLKRRRINATLDQAEETCGDPHRQAPAQPSAPAIPPAPIARTAIR